MLIYLKKLIELDLTASNKKIARIKDLYFNHIDWNINYLETIPDQRDYDNILVHHFQLGQPNLGMDTLPLVISKSQYLREQNAESVKTVAQINNNRLAAYRTWPLVLANMHQLELKEARDLAHIMLQDQPDENEQTDLYSCNEVLGYKIDTNTGDYGHLSNMIVETDLWKIKYLVIKRNKMFKKGRKHLMSPAFVKEINCDTKSIRIEINKKIIRESPEYKGIKSITGKFERRILNHHIKPET